jgi:hypothetical protein
MKPPDRDKPLSRDEWVFLFVAEFSKLRPGAGDKFATLNAQQAYIAHSATEPEGAARAWIKAKRK